MRLSADISLLFARTREAEVSADEPIGNCPRGFAPPPSPTGTKHASTSCSFDLNGSTQCPEIDSVRMFYQDFEKTKTGANAVF